MASPESSVAQVGTSDALVAQVRAQVDELLAAVAGMGAQELSADQVERQLFGRLLALGRELLAVALAQRAQATRRVAVRSSAGVTLAYHGTRVRTYGSLFGPVRVARPYFYAPGAGGAVPADALLGLPAGRCSDVVREWAEELAVGGPYHRAGAVLGRVLGLGVSTRAVQAQVREDGALVPAFYAQRPPPDRREEGALLVLQADGKGVPILRPAAATARRGKGEKPGGKKEAILTALYTIDPAPRTPAAVVASLFKDGDVAASAPRGGPRHKRLYATLAGKDAALAEVAAQVERRDGPHIGQRVALTDGCPALQDRVRARFPAFTLVLDCIHMVEYLWQAGNALLGEAHPRRTAWVRARALLVLSGAGAAVSAELARLARAPARPRRAAATLGQVAAYLERNLPYMRYDEYLARGWPIATGVIEGACRHLVKDRCELSGMRWTIDGAEALLALRCVHDNGDWDAFHAFRRQRRHQQLYHSPAPTPALPPELRLTQPAPAGPRARAA